MFFNRLLRILRRRDRSKALWSIVARHSGTRESSPATAVAHPVRTQGAGGREHPTVNGLSQESNAPGRGIHEPGSQPSYGKAAVPDMVA